MSVVECNKDEAETSPGTCTPCPAGKIQDTVDKTKCKACLADEVETSPGTCTPCPPGEIPHTTDKTSCQKGTTYTICGRLLKHI